MKNGEIQSNSGTKYVRVAIDVWYHEDDDSIHITCGHDFHTNITNKEGSKRYHDYLYNMFKSILEQYGKYPKGK